MEELKNIKLTERDFHLMVEGLEVLPGKDIAGELVMDLMMGAVGGEEGQRKVLAHRKERELSKQKDKDFLIEETRILQGKLLQLKRLMSANGTLSKVHEILNEKDI